MHLLLALITQHASAYQGTQEMAHSAVVRLSFKLCNKGTLYSLCRTGNFVVRTEVLRCIFTLTVGKYALENILLLL